MTVSVPDWHCHNKAFSLRKSAEDHAATRYLIFWNILAITTIIFALFCFPLVIYLQYFYAGPFTPVWRSGWTRVPPTATTRT